jgi:hypothetical protein
MARQARAGERHLLERAKTSRLASTQGPTIQEQPLDIMSMTKSATLTAVTPCF